MYKKLFAEQTRRFDFLLKNAYTDGDEDPAELSSKSLRQKEKFRMKHIAEEIHFDLKELFEICQDVICKESEFRADESSRVLRLQSFDSVYLSLLDFDEEEQLYELADEYLSDFNDRNGIEELYEITWDEVIEKALF